jgi:hypothetical protein
MVKPLAAAGIVIPLVACQTAPNAVTAYGTAQEVFIAAMFLADDLHAAGRITDKQYAEEVVPRVQSGRLILNTWKAAIDAGQPADAATLSAQLQAINDTLRAINAAASTN